MSKTLSKGLFLLTLFNEEENCLKIDDLSKRANIPKSTTYRLLKTLSEYRLIEKVNFLQGNTYVESDYYQLGLLCLELGSKVVSQYEVRQIALPYMKQLRDDLGEAIQLVIQDNGEAIYIEKVESNKPVRLYTRVGRRAPLYAGACPRILLSFMKDEEIRRLLKNELRKVGPDTILSKDTLWEMIRETRYKGYTFSDSELEEGSAAYAVPIFDSSERITASLSLAGFSTTLQNTKDTHYVEPLWEAAAKISKLLGYKPPYPYSKEKQLNGGKL